MKKRGLMLTLVAMLLIAALVSCSDPSNNELDGQGKGLAYATFDKTMTKGLSSSYSGYESYDNLYWYYTAVKKDSYGTTGQTKKNNTDVVVKVPGDNTNHKGLSGQVGPFSEGDWQFTLYGLSEELILSETYNENHDGTVESITYYTTPTEGIVYKGETSDTSPFINLKKNQTNYIPVTVTPRGKTGKVVLYGSSSDNNFSYSWQNSGEVGNLYLTATGTFKAENENSEDDIPITFDTKTLVKENGKYYIDIENMSSYLKIDGSSTVNLPTGIYTITFKVQDTSGDYVFAEQTLSFKVMGGLTTVISGDLVEGLSYENYFRVPEIDIISFTASSTEAKSVEVKVVPQKEEESNKTTKVTFPANSLDTENAQHSLEVSVTPVALATTKFATTAGSSAIAGIDLKLTKIVSTTNTGTGVTTVTEENVSEFNDYVTISTYINKGLEQVNVKYNGTDGKEQPKYEKEGEFIRIFSDNNSIGDNTGYVPSTGLLVFKTNHFSEYYVEAKAYAQNITTNKSYTNLESAITEAIAGDKIRILNNTDIVNPIEINKDLTIDFNGKTITNKVHLDRPFKIYDCTLVIDGNNGHLNIDSSIDDSFGLFDLRSKEKTSSGHEKLIINNLNMEGICKLAPFIAMRCDGQRVELVNCNATMSRPSNLTDYGDCGNDKNEYGNNAGIVNDNDIYGTYSTSLIVKGGTYNYDSRSPRPAFAMNSMDTVIFEDVTIISSRMILENSNTKSEFKNCNFGNPEGSGWLSGTIVVSNGFSGSHVTVNGGTYEGEKCIEVLTTGGSVTVNGGTFTGHNDLVYCYGDAKGWNNSIVTLNNGNFNGNIVAYGCDNGDAYVYINGGNFNNCAFTEKNNNSHIIITGGTFSSDPSDYIATGYKVTEDEGKYTVSMDPEAKIGEKGYVTLEEAIIAAKPGETIVVQKNIVRTTGDSIQFKLENINLDLNGHTIKVTRGEGKNRSFELHGDVIISNGSIETSLFKGTWGAIYAEQNSNVTLNNVNVKAYETNSYKPAYGAAVFGAYGDNPNGNMIINGGTFDSIITTNGSTRNGSLTINSGTFNEALYLPAYMTYTINGGTFYKEVEFRSGIIKVNGGTFNNCSETPSFENVNQDLSMKGCSLSLVAHNGLETGYDYGPTPTLLITGGTFAGKIGLGRVNSSYDYPSVLIYNISVETIELGVN